MRGHWGFMYLNQRVDLNMAPHLCNIRWELRHWPPSVFNCSNPYDQMSSDPLIGEGFFYGNGYLSHQKARRKVSWEFSKYTVRIVSPCRQHRVLQTGHGFTFHQTGTALEVSLSYYGNHLTLWLQTEKQSALRIGPLKVAPVVDTEREEDERFSKER